MRTCSKFVKKMTFASGNCTVGRTELISHVHSIHTIVRTQMYACNINTSSIATIAIGDFFFILRSVQLNGLTNHMIEFIASFEWINTEIGFAVCYMHIPICRDISCVKRAIEAVRSGNGSQNCLRNRHRSL